MTKLLQLPADIDPPMRVKPQQGRPRCLVEEIVQHLWKHRAHYYIASVATVSLLVQLFAVWTR